MLRVEKQLTDLGLVQGKKISQEQGLPLGKQAPTAEEAQLFQTELLGLLGKQPDTENPAEAKLMAMQELGKSPEQVEAIGKQAQQAGLLGLVAKDQAEVDGAVENLKGLESEILPLLGKSSSDEMIHGEVVAKEKALTNNIKSEIKVLEGLLKENPETIKVKVVEAENSDIKKAQAAQVGKMTSPWSMKNILGQDKVSTQDEVAMQSFANEEDNKKSDLKGQKDLNKLDNKVLTGLDDANKRIKQNKSMQKFNSLKQNNSFKSALMTDTVDLKQSGPKVYDGEKFDNIQDIQRNNLMNLTGQVGAGTAADKLSQNMTFKGVDKADGSNIAEVSQKILNYIKQNARVDNGNVEVQFNHEALGDMILKVNEAEKGIVNINLQSMQKQGMEFFKRNQAEIIDVLSKSGIKVADFNVSQSSSSSSSDNGSSNQFSNNGQGQQQSQHRGHQQHQDSQRRKQMWSQYQNQEAA